MIDAGIGVALGRVGGEGEGTYHIRVQYMSNFNYKIAGEEFLQK